MAQVHWSSVCKQARDGKGGFIRDHTFARRPCSTVQAITELRELLGEEVISTDDEDLHRHGYSEWSSINIDQLPVAVAYPKSTEECSAIAKICFKYRIPMSTPAMLSPTPAD